MLMGALAGMQIGETLAAIAGGAVKLGCKEFKGVFNTLSDVFAKAIDSRIQRPVVAYSEIVQYLIQVRKNEPRVRKAALVRKTDNEQALYELYLICLTDKDEILYDSDNNILGRQYTCKNLDSDLVSIFNGKDIVIFQ